MKTKIRIIVRPWNPRNIPFHIPADSVRMVLEQAYPSFKKILYAGWVRRKVNGKTALCYLVATADTTKEARNLFKTSEAYGENVWDLGSGATMKAIGPTPGTHFH